jgi:rubrerythrin
MKIMEIRTCTKCSYTYTINYGNRETDDKPCPSCAVPNGTYVHKLVTTPPVSSS